jgi:GNAT superfamily N-acetyltransferase
MRYEVWQEQEDPTRFVHIFVFRDAKADRIDSEDSAWDGELMVGIARSLTDFSYVAYLSDLAVRESHQRLGIGTDLIRQTRAALGPRSMLVLLAVPAAVDYYPRVGFSHHPQAWILRAGEPLGGERQPGQKTPI